MQLGNLNSNSATYVNVLLFSLPIQDNFLNLSIMFGKVGFPAQMRSSTNKIMTPVISKS